MDRELVSVLMVNYNRGTTIGESIKSVLAQTYTDLELIIVDDGSTDETLNVIQKYMNDKRIKYIYKENGGQSSARNVGLKNALGKYIMFLDDDDELCDTALERALEKIKKSKCPWIYCNQYLSVREEGNIIVDRGEGKKGNIYEYLLLGHFLGMGEIFSKEIFEKVGYFDEKLKIYEDKEVRLRLAKEGYEVDYIEGYIYKYYENLNSVSNANKNKIKRKIRFYQAQLKMYNINKEYIDTHLNVYYYWMKMLRRINLETKRYKSSVYYSKECLKIEKNLRNYRKLLQSMVLSVLFQDKFQLKEN